MKADQTFWAKPADAEAGWMDDLSSEPVDAADDPRPFGNGLPQRTS